MSLGTAGGGGATAVLTTTASAPAGGSIIVSVTLAGTTAAMVGVTDSAGNAYSIDVEYRAGPRAHVALASCHGALALAAGGTITVTASEAVDKGMMALSVSGLATAAARDKTASNGGSGSGWATGSTGTLSQADELAVGTAVSLSEVQSTPAATWTEIADFLAGDEERRSTVVYKVLSATSAVEASGTWAADSWAAAIATYGTAANASARTMALLGVG